MINLQTSYFRSLHIFKDSIERVYEMLRRPQAKCLSSLVLTSEQRENKVISLVILGFLLGYQ